MDGSLSFCFRSNIPLVLSDSDSIQAWRRHTTLPSTLCAYFGHQDTSSFLASFDPQYPIQEFLNIKLL